jgi:hypothetical protein
MIVSQEYPADVTPVESALALLIASQSQAERARIVGLAGHAQISRRESKLVTGEADTYLEVYPAHYLLRVAKSDARLADTIIAWLKADKINNNDAEVEKDLSALAQRQAAEIAHVLSDLNDGDLSPAEAATHSTALQELQKQIHDVRIKLDRRATGRRK